MKKTLLSALCLMVLFIGSAFALYVTTNTFNTQWSGTTTITAGSYSDSDYVQTAGANYALLSVSGSTPITSAEAIWYYSSGSTIFTREAIVDGTPLAVKTTRAKFRLYSTNIATPCAFIYGY